MLLTKRLLCFLFLLLTLSFPTKAYDCGKERWPVKVAQDDSIKYFFDKFDLRTRRLIDPAETTIAKLHAWPWPFANRKKPPTSSYSKRSSSKAEYQIWIVTAFLTVRPNEEDDGDYHLVLTSGERTLVAEIPHPNCVRETPEPIRSMIMKARRDFDKWWARRPRGPVNQLVRVMGIGMFDILDHATGSSPNGIELHPVLAIKFLDRR